MNCPLDLEEICVSESFMSQHLEHSFSKHFAFEAYETLVEGGSLPDLQNSFTNGSLCKNYVKNFISFVSVSSPTTSVMKTVRDKRFTFNDQLGTIGGTLGLFTGMSILSMVEVLFFIMVLVQCFIIEIIGIFGNPEGLNMDYFTSKKDQKKACDNEKQMKCGEKCPQKEDCQQQIKNLSVSQSECFIWPSNFIWAIQK